MSKSLIADEIIGKSYQGDLQTIAQDELIAFAHATQADHPLYQQGELAPPLFSARFLNPLFLKIFIDIKIDFFRLVFAGIDLKYETPITPGLELFPLATIAALEEKPSGHLLTIDIFIENEEKTYLHGNAQFFLRGASKAKREPKEKNESPSILKNTQIYINENQAKLFSEAAKDPNPIHLDENMAKRCGFSGVILQGLCTMGLSISTIMKALEKEPSDLIHIAGRFVKPAYLAQYLETTIYSPNQNDSLINQYLFTAKTEDGVEVIADGLARFKL